MNSTSQKIEDFNFKYLKSKSKPINVIYNSNHMQYNIFHSNQSNKITSSVMQLKTSDKEALESIQHRFKTIKFAGLNNLIEFCRNEKIFNLQIVFEWIFFFIYKV
jgi:hypothetical protein